MPFRNSFRSQTLLQCALSAVGVSPLHVKSNCSWITAPAIVRSIVIWPSSTFVQLLMAVASSPGSQCWLELFCRRIRNFRQFEYAVVVGVSIILSYFSFDIGAAYANWFLSSCGYVLLLLPPVLGLYFVMQPFRQKSNSIRRGTRGHGVDVREKFKFLCHQFLVGAIPGFIVSSALRIGLASLEEFGIKNLSFDLARINEKGITQAKGTIPFTTFLISSILTALIPMSVYIEQKGHLFVGKRAYRISHGGQPLIDAFFIEAFIAPILGVQVSTSISRIGSLLNKPLSWKDFILDYIEYASRCALQVGCAALLGLSVSQNREHKYFTIVFTIHLCRSSLARLRHASKTFYRPLFEALYICECLSILGAVVLIAFHIRSLYPQQESSEYAQRETVLVTE